MKNKEKSRHSPVEVAEATVGLDYMPAHVEHIDSRGLTTLCDSCVFLSEWQEGGAECMGRREYAFVDCKHPRVVYIRDGKPRHTFSPKYTGGYGSYQAVVTSCRFFVEKPKEEPE